MIKAVLKVDLKNFELIHSAFLYSNQRAREAWTRKENGWTGRTQKKGMDFKFLDAETSMFLFFF